MAEILLFFVCVELLQYCIVIFLWNCYQQLSQFRTFNAIYTSPYQLFALYQTVNVNTAGLTGTDKSARLQTLQTFTWRKLKSLLYIMLALFRAV